MESESSDSQDERNKSESDSDIQDRRSTFDSRKKTNSLRNKGPIMYELKNDPKMTDINLGNIKAKKNAKYV